MFRFALKHVQLRKQHRKILHVCYKRPTIFGPPLPPASPLLIFPRPSRPPPPPPSSQCSHPQSDIYFVSSAPVSSASNCSSRDTSSHSSPQTPTGYEMPVFPSPLGDGESQRRQDVDVTSLRFGKVPPPTPTPLSPPPADLFDFGTTLPTFICINFLFPAERFIEAAVFLLRSSCLRTADSPSSSASDLNKFFPPIVVVIIAPRILLYHAFTPPD